MLAALALASCRQEKELEFAPVGEIGQGEVTFKIGSVATRSDSEARSEETTLATVNVGDAILSLNETVTSLDVVSDSPATRGTPAFTENVANLYGTFNAVANPNSTDAASRLADASFPFDGATFWRHDYRMADIWTKAPYQFFMRMPADVPGVAVGTLTYRNDDGSIRFSYTTPATATAQKDILFTSTTLENETQNGKEVTFYHALTGVKFANYFNNNTSISDNKTETIIREVTVSGLKNTGNCVVTPSAGEGEGKSAAASYWSGQDGNASFTQTYEEAFAEYGSTYALDSKLNHTADKHNLNDANGSLTFWFIPQTLTSSVKIKVKFDIRVNGNVTFANQELEVSLGEVLSERHLTWHAGELHTFTLRPEKVGIKIVDEMTSATTKANVKFTNTGNVDQYVRVYIIGNWYGKRQIKAGEYNDYESILMGYVSGETNSDGSYVSNEEVARWNDKDFKWSGEVGTSNKVYEKWISPAYPLGYVYTPYGDFDGLPEKGTDAVDDNPGAPGRDNGKNWIRHDKFYYYTELIGPGKDLPTTNPLFTTYTVNRVPDFWIADISGVRRLAKDVHLELDIAVQAIAVPYDENGDAIPYDEAWAAALGVTVEGLNDL